MQAPESPAFPSPTGDREESGDELSLLNEFLEQLTASQPTLPASQPLNLDQRNLLAALINGTFDVGLAGHTDPTATMAAPLTDNVARPAAAPPSTPVGLLPTLAVEPDGDIAPQVGDPDRIPSSTSSTRAGTPVIVRTPWTPGEDAALRQAVEHYGANTEQWPAIAACVPGRGNKSCRKRWNQSLDPALRRGAWTRQEDLILGHAVERYGHQWSRIARMIEGRTDDQCAKRWREALDPAIDRNTWTVADDTRLLAAVAELGSQWQRIAARHFPARPGVHCRNRWRQLTREQRRQGRGHKRSIDDPIATPATVMVGLPPTKRPKPTETTSRPTERPAPLAIRPLIRAPARPPIQFTPVGPPALPHATLPILPNTSLPVPLPTTVSDLELLPLPDISLPAELPPPDANWNASFQSLFAEGTASDFDVTLDSLLQSLGDQGPGDAATGFTLDSLLGDELDCVNPGLDALDLSTQLNFAPPKSVDLFDAAGILGASGSRTPNPWGKGSDLADILSRALASMEQEQSEAANDEAKTKPRVQKPKRLKPKKKVASAVVTAVQSPPPPTLPATSPPPAADVVTRTPESVSSPAPAEPSSPGEGTKKSPEVASEEDQQLRQRLDELNLSLYGCALEDCKEAFRNAPLLVQHARAAHGDDPRLKAPGARPYCCAMNGCYRTYKNVNGLQYHIFHSKGSAAHFFPAPDGSINETLCEEKPYKCPEAGCRKKYKNANGLQYHRLHTHQMAPTPAATPAASSAPSPTRPITAPLARSLTATVGLPSALPPPLDRAYPHSQPTSPKLTPVTPAVPATPTPACKPVPSATLTDSPSPSMVLLPTPASTVVAVTAAATPGAATVPLPPSVATPPARKSPAPKAPTVKTTAAPATPKPIPKSAPSRTKTKAKVKSATPRAPAKPGKAAPVKPSSKPSPSAVSTQADRKSTLASVRLSSKELAEKIDRTFHPSNYEEFFKSRPSVLDSISPHLQSSLRQGLGTALSPASRASVVAAYTAEVAKLPRATAIVPAVTSTAAATPVVSPAPVITDDFPTPSSKANPEPIAASVPALPPPPPVPETSIALQVFRCQVTGCQAPEFGSLNELAEHLEMVHPLQLVIEASKHEV
ncbi:hypothetical protein IWQ60_001112 [Tieghemiomyces parasiticus]|uniref:Uncharacterized protein n=1 Tax=Tieghemiomyces parasiticus TaxID=78921 RepID=A0A9W8AET1_9FUNG|nr:hypothetical protein IWQ60_001112 [Tieghemiomyces parasiticus]